MWVCARGVEKPQHVSRGATALQGALALGSMLKSKTPPQTFHILVCDFWGLLLPFFHTKNSQKHHFTSLDWHLLEEYDRFLSLPTLVSRVYRSPTRSHFRKRLAKLLGLKTPIVDVLTRYGSSLGGSILFNFLLCWFGKPECLTTYRGDFVDLEEHWTFYRCQAFMVAFFGSVLFPFPLGSISFVVLHLVSTLPHSTSFIPSILFETIWALSLYRETGSDRLGYYVHLLQLWFCSHLSVISRA